MGRRELGIRKIPIKNFDQGYFPNQDFDAVPDGGSPNCRHVLHRRGALRPFPGMDVLNTAAATQLTGQGLHYLNVRGAKKRAAVFGTKFYELDGGTWVDRTGAVVIGAGALVQFIDHQQGANRYAIGCPGGGNPPFKWTGSGNATLLGGSPPNFTTIAKYHDIVFGGLDEFLYFSDTGDPETWNTGDWVLPFEKDIVRALDHGPTLAVLMDDHIGSVQGYDALDFVAEEGEITTFGCVGKLAATKCRWGSNDLKVIATVARDGIWIFDEAYSANKIYGDDDFTEFNQDALSKASMAYWRAENLLFIALPYGASTECDHVLVINMKTGAAWPAPSIHAGTVRAMASMRDANNNEAIYFQNALGHALKFNMDTISYHTGTETQEIDAYWQSKRFDLEDLYSLGELVMLADVVGDWGVNVGVKFGLGQGDGTTGTIQLSADQYLLGSTMVLGGATLGGSNYIFESLTGVGGSGRFMQIAIARQGNQTTDLLGSTFVLTRSRLSSSQSFRVRWLEAHLHRHREGGNDQ